MIVRAKQGSRLCAVTSVDCPNPCFAPNRYYTSGLVYIGHEGTAYLTLREGNCEPLPYCSDSTSGLLSQGQSHMQREENNIMNLDY